MEMINNENVIKFADYIESKSKCYIFMEKCDTDFEKYLIERGRHIIEEEAVKYLKQLLNGLSALHKLNIIYRELRASSILLKNGNIKIDILSMPRGYENNEERYFYPLYIAPEIIKH